MLSWTDDCDRPLFTSTIDHYSPTRVNSFQIDLRQTDVHKSLQFTDRSRKIRKIFLTDYYSSASVNITLIDSQTDSSEVTLWRLMFINSIFHNILQVSTDRLTWVSFTYSGYFWRLTMVHYIYKRTDFEDIRHVQFSGSNLKVQFLERR